MNAMTNIHSSTSPISTAYVSTINSTTDRRKRESINFIPIITIIYYLLSLNTTTSIVSSSTHNKYRTDNYIRYSCHSHKCYSRFPLTNFPLTETPLAHLDKHKISIQVLSTCTLHTFNISFCVLFNLKTYPNNYYCSLIQLS